MQNLENGQMQVQVPSPITQLQKQDWPWGTCQYVVFWPRVRGWHVSCVTGKGQRCVLQNMQSASSKPQPAQQEGLCFLWSVPHHNTAALQNRTHFPTCLELYDLTEQSNSTLTKTEQTESRANSVWQASGIHSEEEYFLGNFIPNGL